MSEKIFSVGASGDIGSNLVRFLLKKEDVKVTLYVRDAEKTKNMFTQVNSEALNIVQGDYTTTDVFQHEIVGHSRLFILVAADHRMPGIKGTFAKIAYGAGVRQIVDISSSSVNMPYRYGIIGAIHRESEERILAEKEDNQFYVALRPDRFFSNHLKMDAYGIKTMQTLNVIYDLDFKEDFISTTDIAELASIVLTEPVEKHANCVYTMIGETFSTNERAAIFSELLGKPIKGNTIPVKVFYDQIIAVGFPHSMAIEFCQNKETTGPTPYYSIMLGRPAQTLREWLQEDNNLSYFQ